MSQGIIELRTLGVLELRERVGQGGVHPVRLAPTPAAVLVYLALARPYGARSRDEVVGVFWPDRAQSRARAALSQTLYRIRRALDAELLVSRGDNEIALELSLLRCDALEFDAALDGGRPEDGLELYGGELLAGFHLPDVREFALWLETERRRYRDRAVEAARTAASAEEAAGNPVGALPWLRRAAVLAPYDESVLRELVDLLTRLGDRSGAVRAYEEFAQRLFEELELSPSAETEALVRRARTAGERAAPEMVPEERDGPSPPGDGNVQDRRGRDAVAAAPAHPVGAAPGAAAGYDGVGSAGEIPGAVPVLHRRARAFMLAVLALVIGTGAMTGVLGPGEPAPAAPASVDRVAVLPFAVRGSERFAYLGEGMAVLLSARLDGAGPLRSVDPRAVLNFLEPEGARSGEEDSSRVGPLAPPTPDSAEATAGRRVAQRFGAGRFVAGSVVEAGGRLMLHGALYDAEGALLAEASTEPGDETGLFVMVDDLARELVSSRYEGAADRLSRLATRTTHSLPALKAYLRGERAFRTGRYSEAADAFAHAALADSTFALAHYRLSLATVWAEAPGTLPFDADARALRHAARLSDHDRMLIDAYLAWRHGAADEAEALYRRVLAMYPEDVEAWRQLGETLFHYNPLRGRGIAEARAPFERVVELDAENWAAIWHLALMAASEGRLESFEQLSERLLALEPGADEALQVRVLRAVAAGDHAAEAALATRLRETHYLDLHDVLWRAAVHLRDLDAAERVARLLTSPERLSTPRLFGHQALAYLALARGRRATAEEHIDVVARLDSLGGFAMELRAAIALQPLVPPSVADLRALRREVAAWNPTNPSARIQRLRLSGILATALGDTIAALEHIRTLERAAVAAEPTNSAEVARAAMAAIRARLARSAGRTDEVLRLLDAARLGGWFGWTVTSPVRSGSAERFLRAELLAELGRDEEALRWYATFGEHGIHDLLYLAPSHLRRAEIHERRGDVDAARRHYARFIELWDDADPELQGHVEAARRRIS